MAFVDAKAHKFVNVRQGYRFNKINVDVINGNFVEFRAVVKAVVHFIEPEKGSQIGVILLNGQLGFSFNDRHIIEIIANYGRSMLHFKIELLIQKITPFKTGFWRR